MRNRTALAIAGVVFVVLVILATIAGGFGPLELVVVLVMAGVVYLVLGIIVLATRGRRARPCPRCGRDVPTGALDCEACGFDFRTIGASPG